MLWLVRIGYFDAYVQARVAEAVVSVTAGTSLRAEPSGRREVACLNLPSSLDTITAFGGFRGDIAALAAYSKRRKVWIRAVGPRALEWRLGDEVINAGYCRGLEQAVPCRL